MTNFKINVLIICSSKGLNWLRGLVRGNHATCKIFYYKKQKQKMYYLRQLIY